MVPSDTSSSQVDDRFWSRIKPETVFLMLALPFGLALLVLNPPFQAADEYDHFFRAVQLSQGVVVGEKHGNSAGGQIPLLVMGVANTEGIPFHPEKKMTAEIFRRKADPRWVDWSRAQLGYAHFPHTVYYHPVAYVPQTLVIAAAKLAHVGPLGLMYAARVSVWAFSCALGWMALRLMPVYRWSCLLLLVVPMNLYLMGSIAMDGVLIAAAFLFAALLAQLATRLVIPGGWRSPALFLALACIVSTAKPVYAPLACAGALIALARLKTWSRRGVFAAAFVVVCVLPAYMWTKIAAGVYAPGRTDIPIDPVAQSRHIVDHPFRFLGLIGQTLKTDFRGIYEWFVGVLGWGDTWMPAWYYVAFAGALALCVILESAEARTVFWRTRAVLLAGAVGAVVLIFAAQYMSWNAPGSQTTIDGIEGRYFLPLAPFLLLAFPAVLPSGRRAAVVPWLATLFGAIGAITSVAAVIFRYYVA